MPLPFNIYSLLLLAILSLAGCQKGGQETSIQGENVGYGKAAAPTAKFAPPEMVADEVAGVLPAAVSPQAAGQERMLIRTGELTMEMDSAEKAAEQIRLYVAGLGGYVSESSIQNEPGSEELALTLVLRLPNIRYDLALRHLRAQGKYIRSQSTATQDVTEEFVDVEARLGTRRSLEARYLQLLAQARRVEDMVAIEEKLATVRGEIESMQGRLKYLGNQVALSTLTLRLVELHPAIQGPGPGFGRQLYEAAAESLQMVKDLLLSIVRLLPSLLIVGAVLYALFRGFAWWKHRQSKSQ